MTPKSTIDQNSFVPWAEFLVRDNLPSLVLICLAVWLHAVDSMIVATMLPSIVADIGGESLVSWSISLYEIASVVAGAASALLTMRFGLRLPLSLAAALFGVGCFISAGSPTMALFLIGRCLQGLGGGGLVAMAFVSVGALFARRYTARALAVLSAFWGIAAFLGPLIGGLFVGFSTWRWGYVFFGGQAVGLALWILIRPEQSAPISTEAMTFPMRRLALLCIAVLLISIGGIDVSALKTSLFVIAGLICIAAFLHLDGQAGPNRLLPLQPFNLQNTTGAALLMIMSLAVATVALTAFGPLLMTVIHGISALTAGYLVACSSIGWTIA
ncbi:MAG: MFS transporter, partial [Pseudoruegeria sp.]